MKTGQSSGCPPNHVFQTDRTLSDRFVTFHYVLFISTIENKECKTGRGPGCDPIHVIYTDRTLSD